MRSLFIFSASAFLLLSCEKITILQSDDMVQENYPGVDPRLHSLFTLFEDEATVRGYSYDLKALGITGEIFHIDEANIAGTCRYGQHIAHVTIDETFWNDSHDLLREMVVFHELGHCVLKRGHEDTSFSNGACASLMNSGLSQCQVVYDETNRNFYLDELFQNSALN
jgi:hypothetical protein